MKPAKIVVVLMAMAVSASAVVFAVDPAGPTTAPATGLWQWQACASVMPSKKDLMSVSIDLKEKVGPPRVLFDAAKRKDLAAVATPLFKKYKRC